MAPVSLALGQRQVAAQSTSVGRAGGLPKQEMGFTTSLCLSSSFSQAFRRLVRPHCSEYSLVRTGHSLEACLKLTVSNQQETDGEGHSQRDLDLILI